ncbi:hypothetical protein BLSTO_06616 [Blastocystis sp. subtype 1]
MQAELTSLREEKEEETSLASARQEQAAKLAEEKEELERLVASLEEKQASLQQSIEALEKKQESASQLSRTSSVESELQKRLEAYQKNNLLLNEIIADENRSTSASLTMIRQKDEEIYRLKNQIAELMAGSANRGDA